MKTILYVYHASNIGGGSYAMLNVIKALDRNRYKPVVLLKSHGPLVDELKSMGIEVYLLPNLNTVPYNAKIMTTRNIVRVIRIMKSLGQFAKLLKSINPDIVYLNTMMLHPYLKIIKKQGIKSIIHIREHWPEKEHTIQRNYAINNIRKYADRIIAINSYSASMVADETHKPVIVYDWIDMSNRYKEMPFDAIFGEDCSEKKVYLCTGGFDRIKGTLEIVRAFTSTIKGEECRLLVLGTKPAWKNSYADALNEEIEKDKRIKIIPNTYFVSHLYQQAYCVLSYFKIPHANLALAENVILQTPVIAAQNEEALEYSLNGELATLFEANNVNDFKEKLLRFDDGKRNALKERLKEKAYIIENLFDPETNKRKIDETYDSFFN